MSNETSVPLEANNDEELARDVVDDQDTSRGEADFKPWDPGKIRITTKHFSIRDVVDQIRDNEIDLLPDFQRDYIWKTRQKTRLVESILLGIPLPAFYLNQDKDGTYQVVDGVQRLSTIFKFMEDSHVLTNDDLEYLTHLHGLTYSKLDPAALRRFRSAQIVVHVIEPQTPEEVKYDIFGRVNTLGSPLSAQEIRHAMSKARSRHFLKKLCELTEFDNATGWHFWRRDNTVDGGRVRDSGRMTNRELVLRFCAFRRYSDEEYRHYSSLDAFLVEYTRRLDGRSEKGAAITDEDLDRLSADFERAMDNAYHVLGKAAFRRWPPTQNRRGPINGAVFEAQAIALADYSLDHLLPRKNEIVDALRAAFDDNEYARAVTVGTGDPKKLEMRLERTKTILAEVMK